MNLQLSKKITSANVILTCLILLLHSTWNDPSFSPLWTITDLAVPTFFFISSFLYFIKWELSFHCYLQKTWARIQSLLLPLFIYNMLAWCYYMVTTGYLSLWPSKSPPPCNFFSIIAYIWNSEGDTPLWFLSALFKFALFAPLIGIIMKSSRWSILLSIIVSLYTQNLPYNHTFFWLPCLMGGAWCALWLPYLTKIWNGFRSIIPSGVCVFIGIITFAMYCLIFMNITDRSHDSFYYIYRMVSPLLLMLIMADTDILPAETAKKLSTYTLYAYGMHFPIIELMKVTSRLLNFEILIIQYSFIVISTCTLIFFTASFLKKQFPYVWYLMNGCRLK